MKVGLRMKRKVRWKLGAALLPFIILVIGFEMIPLAAMVAGSFQSDGGTAWTLHQYATALGNPFYTIAIRNSVIISFYSTIIGLSVALFAAYSITRMSESFRDRILMISNMTSNFAGVPLAFGYIILLGNNGIFTLLLQKSGWNVLGDFSLYSWSGLVLVYVYFQVPLAVLLLYPTYYGIREQWKEAAALLGASTFHFWHKIGLPLILPGIAGTATILFANAMGAYATAYALVGGNYNLLAVRIGSLIAGDVITKPQLGSALAVLLALLMLGSFWLNDRMTRRVRRDLK